MNQDNGFRTSWEKTYILRSEAQKAVAAALDDAIGRIVALRKQGPQPCGQELFWYRVALDAAQKTLQEMREQRGGG